MEYAAAPSAKAMIDYFRNAHMTCAHPFDFLVMDGDASTQFTEDEIRQLALTRASYAKSSIHDHHPKDAVLEPVSPASGEGCTFKPQPCTFGLPAVAPQLDDHGALTSIRGRFADPSSFHQAAPHTPVQVRESTLSLGLFDTTGTW